MVTVGQRVKEAIDYMGQEMPQAVTSALTPACIALDVTSQRHAGASRSARKHFKKFVQDYLWLITYVGFPGLMSSTVRVPFAHPDVKPDAAGTVGLEDIVYHVIRCSLIHSDERAAKVVWNREIGLGLDSNGDLVLNNQLVWGLVSAVVVAPENRNETIPNDYWLQIGPFRNFVSELWGREDLAKRIIKHATGVDIP